MALVSEKLKSCGLRINATVCGVPGVGSGVLYRTPNYCTYNYVLTAKHIFQEDSHTEFEFNKVSSIEVLHFEAGKFKRLEFIKKSEIKDKLIDFDEDFAIIIVQKNENVPFRQIVVSDDLNDEDVNFTAWGTFSANSEELHRFNFERNDPEMRRLKLPGNHQHVYLPGMSGAGVFFDNKNVLYGVISKYPNEKFQNETIDCTKIFFSDVNNKLKSLKRVVLDTDKSSFKKEIDSEIVDIHQAYINDVCLNLELARKRLKVDIVDDWYHDPLKYIDLLNQSYLFDQFSDHFGPNKYEACEAEKFYVPKKKFTLRLALISPFMDRIMYIAVVGVLANSLDEAMINNVYSARYNKFSDNQLILNGVEQWKKMRYKLEECANLKDDEGNYVYGCVIEIDLLNFYDNINKQLLHEKILRVCENENERRAAILLQEILKSLTTKELGLPQNSDASSLLASFYLNQVDIFMQHHTSEYFRFMDDIRIFCKDKYQARGILQTFEFELRRCYLSVNSQKTEIFTLTDRNSDKQHPNKKSRNEFGDIFDLTLSKIARLRSSNNHVYLNEAFHACIKLLEENLNDSANSDLAAKKMNFAFNSLSLLAIKGVNINDNSEFLDLIKKCTRSLKDRPWITPEICKVLNLISSDVFTSSFMPILIRMVMKEKYNIYSFQTYQIWLLLAKHKCNRPELRQYAVKRIERNDDTNRAVIAAMVIYLCSVEKGYRRVILRKLGEGFTHGYFENRTALIALRSFGADMINHQKVDRTLKNAHPYTHKFKNKDLVFVPGFDEDDDGDMEAIEQLYSI